MPYFHEFLEKVHLNFQKKEKKTHSFGGTGTSFPDNTRKIIFPCNFFGKTIFSEHLKKMSYFHVFCFLRKIIFHFPSKE